MRRFAAVLGILCVASSTSVAAQDYRVVFEGRPVVRVQLAFGEDAQTTALNPDEAFKYAVRIVERVGKYYWASRDMRELIRVEAGSYVTYTDRNGAG